MEKDRTCDRERIDRSHNDSRTGVLSNRFRGEEVSESPTPSTLAQRLKANFKVGLSNILVNELKPNQSHQQPVGLHKESQNLGQNVIWDKM